MLASLARKLLVIAAVTGAVYVAYGYGRLAAALTLLVCLAVIGATTVWLPRAAHNAFERGDYGRSALYYAILRYAMLDGGARRSCDVSLAACDVARERYSECLRRLEQVSVDRLSDATRSAYLNNQAYALARGGTDANAALASADEAIALRPAVAGFRHTRGVALLALGRVDDAIKELDAVWAELSGDAPALLEAERCYDLGMAWRRKGERDYATDYFERAQRAAPESRWAERAAEELGARPVSSRAVLPELV